MSSVVRASLARYSRHSTIAAPSAFTFHPPTAPRRPLSSAAAPSAAPQVIPPATLEGDAKHYSPKIEKLVAEIGQLTLLEVADLNELLKRSLRIPDAAPMMMMGGGNFAGGPGGAAARTQEEEDAPAAPAVKTLFTVRLTKYDEARKVALIKEVKGIVAGMNLVQAKKFVETLPQTLRADVSKEEAEKLKAALEAVGAGVEVD